MAVGVKVGVAPPSEIVKNMAVGFIGAGSIGGAVITGLVRNGFDNDEIIVKDNVYWNGVRYV